MTIKFNPQALEAVLEQTGERALKGMSDRMRRTAIKIRDLAREFAPIRTGELEDAIDYETVKGANRRNSFVVLVRADRVVSGEDEDGGTKTIGDYAWEMEEGLSPYGSGKYQLGPWSLAKRASGSKVGGKFLARAVREGTKNIDAEMLDAVRRVLGNGVINRAREFDGDDE